MEWKNGKELIHACDSCAHAQQLAPTWVKFSVFLVLLEFSSWIIVSVTPRSWLPLSLQSLLLKVCATRTNVHGGNSAVIHSKDGKCSAVYALINACSEHIPRPDGLNILYFGFFATVTYATFVVTFWLYVSLYVFTYIAFSRHAFKQWSWYIAFLSQK